MKIYCCGCGKEVEAELVTGEKIYPTREDLKNREFYQCECGLYIGCNPKTKKPSGSIPTEELRKARGHIYKVLTPLLKNNTGGKYDVYNKINEKLGSKCYISYINDVEKAREVYKVVKELASEVEQPKSEDYPF